MSTKAQVKTQAKTPAAPLPARMIQPPVGVPEHEAERPDIATQLEGAARLGHSLGAVSVDSSPPPIIQRQEFPEEEEEELQLKREPSAVQRQEIPEEEEEELQLKREPSAVQRQEIPEEEEEELQMMPAPPGQVALQRQELPDEEEELMMRRDDQRVGPQGGQFPPDVEAAIHRARAGGQPLDGALQWQMGETMGHDFNGVRVHTDAEADALNQQLSARAFTTGRDIFFQSGEYNPGSDNGQELIAHELTHVVQQNTGSVSGSRTKGSVGAQAKLTVSDPNDVYEQEADRVAEAVTRSIRTPAQRPLPAEEGLMQGKFAGQRQSGPEEEDEVMQGMLKRQRGEPEEDALMQRKFAVQRQTTEEEELLQGQPAENEGLSDSNDLETRINSARGGGHPLPDNVRQPMEMAFGADFSRVRAHTDSVADTLNWGLSAKAFTIGQDVFFREGEYSTSSESGKRLIAHELTHIAQQGERGDMSQGIRRANGALTITIRNTKGGTPRRRIGVGEEVVLTGSEAGNWTATQGALRVQGSGGQAVWRAPFEAAKPTITLSKNGKSVPVTMEVVEPDGATAKRVAGTVEGIGMRLRFAFSPAEVSFYNIETKEDDCDPTSVSGYFEDAAKFPGEALKHQAGTQWNPVTVSNDDSAVDVVSLSRVMLPKPYSGGGFKWVIPNRYRGRGVDDPQGGKIFTHVTQEFSIEANGTVTVAKGGHEVVEQLP
jgi:hypothetical protein